MYNEKVKVTVFTIKPISKFACYNPCETTGTFKHVFYWTDSTTPSHLEAVLEKRLSLFWFLHGYLSVFYDGCQRNVFTNCGSLAFPDITYFSCWDLHSRNISGTRPTQNTVKPLLSGQSKSQHINVSRLVLHLSLPNKLIPWKFSMALNDKYSYFPDSKFASSVFVWKQCFPYWRS